MYHAKTQAAYHKRVRIKLRQQLLEKFGNVCACPGCNESTIELLTVDHKNGEGAQHKKRISGQETRSRNIIKYGSKEDYQILCHNCNWGKGMYGQCPHLKL